MAGFICSAAGTLSQHLPIIRNMIPRPIPGVTWLLCRVRKVARRQLSLQEKSMSLAAEADILILVTFIFTTQRRIPGQQDHPLNRAGQREQCTIVVAFICLAVNPNRNEKT